MIEETPIRTRVVEYFDPTSRDLIAVCLTDVLDDGVSMVYSFFDPDLSANSLGTYIILDHVRIARENGLPYVYLGYWVPGSQKMGYKSRFTGLEVYRNDAWCSLSDEDRVSDIGNPLDIPPISEQVASIRLPDARPVK